MMGKIGLPGGLVNLRIRNKQKGIFIKSRFFGTSIKGLPMIMCFAIIQVYGWRTKPYVMWWIGLCFMKQGMDILR